MFEINAENFKNAINEAFCFTSEDNKTDDLSYVFIRHTEGERHIQIMSINGHETYLQGIEIIDGLPNFPVVEGKITQIALNKENCNAVKAFLKTYNPSAIRLIYENGTIILSCSRGEIKFLVKNGTYLDLMKFFHESRVNMANENQVQINLFAPSVARLAKAFGKQKKTMKFYTCLCKESFIYMTCGTAELVIMPAKNTEDF